MVYDVLIEGVSLVANYRAQFNKIIQTSSYSALIDKLRSTAPVVPVSSSSSGSGGGWPLGAPSASRP
jgi:hypothetical protein